MIKIYLAMTQWEISIFSNFKSLLSNEYLSVKESLKQASIFAMP